MEPCHLWGQLFYTSCTKPTAERMAARPGGRGLLGCCWSLALPTHHCASLALLARLLQQLARLLHLLLLQLTLKALLLTTRGLLAAALLLQHLLLALGLGG